jgi:hypothetical protein
MALDRAAGFFEIATPLAEAIPILGAPVKGAFEATSKILKYAGVSCGFPLRGLELIARTGS